MCGVSGIITSCCKKSSLPDRLNAMCSLQKHRGPDDRRHNVFQAFGSVVGLGFTRLSIIDLETGMQPIVCQKDKRAIVCNGQVYNYIELKQQLENRDYSTRGDIEVALHAYRERGLDFLNILNGMYAGAIFDPLEGRVVLFRDRFGIKPLYYTEYDGYFVFASEIRALLAGSRRPCSLNRRLLGTFFTYRYVPGENTLFDGVKRLPPGSFLVYDLEKGAYGVSRYWEYRPGEKKADIGLDEAQERFYDLFSDAVKIRLRSDVEVGCFLSGGIDSSAVAARAVGYNGPSKLFTVSFDEDRYNELPDVSRFLSENSYRFGGCSHVTTLCGKGKLEQLPDIIESLEEPISLGTVLPTDQICALAGERLKVVVTGEGADEIFAGYRKFLLEGAAEEFGNASLERKEKLKVLFPELEGYLAVRERDPAKRYIQSEALFTAEELAMFVGDDAKEAIFPFDALPSVGDGVHPVNASIAFECRARLPDYVLLRLDKLSMRHSLETRTPFLDYRLAEFAASLPVHMKVDPIEDTEKVICRKSFSRYGLLDGRTAFRKKQPFTIPMADWLSEPATLPEWMQEIVLGDVVRKQGVVDPDLFARMVGAVSAEGVGPTTLVSDADRVFAVVIFTVWYDMFMNSNALLGSRP